MPATRSAGAANGCGRAERSAWLGLFTVRLESSAHRHKPLAVDQNPCRTSMQYLAPWMRGRQANERNQPDDAGTPSAAAALVAPGSVLRALPEVRGLALL